MALASLIAYRGAAATPAAIAAPVAPAAPRQICGAKYLGRMFPLLAKLRPEGCARDRAGSHRTLIYGPYGRLALLSMCSPSFDSLRAIQQASTLPKVRRLLGCSRASLGSLSEAARVFDPRLLGGCSRSWARHWSRRRAAAGTRGWRTCGTR